MTESTATQPDWLQPGTAVVLYTPARGMAGRSVKLTTIKAVGKQWITVDDQNEPRIRIDTLRSASQGSRGWSSYARYLVAADSDEGRDELDRARRGNLKMRANDLARLWLREPSKENRLALIEALQAIEDE